MSSSANSRKHLCLISQVECVVLVCDDSFSVSGIGLVDRFSLSPEVEVQLSKQGKAGKTRQNMPNENVDSGILIFLFGACSNLVSLCPNNMWNSGNYFFLKYTLSVQTR